jgi:broad specificity phosphatase PhoE
MTEPRPRFVITLLRHGESVGNAEARWQGQADFPLNDTGRTQARALAERWQAEEMTFERIFASPLLRARETAEIVASALNVPVELNPVLLERAIGEYSGLTGEEVRQFARSEFINPYDAVGGDGEGDWALFLRAGQALHQLLRQPVGKYLVVSHGGLLNQFMHAVIGAAPHANNGGPRFRFGNTGFSRLFYFPSQHRWEIDTHNDRTHWIGESPY